MSIDPGVVPRAPPVVGEERRLLLLARDLGPRVFVTAGVQSQNAKRRKTMAAARAIQAAQAEMNIDERAIIPALEGNLASYNYYKVFDPRSMRATADPQRQQVLDTQRERDAERNAELAELPEESEEVEYEEMSAEEMQRRADVDNEEAAEDLLREVDRAGEPVNMTRQELATFVAAQRRRLERRFESTRFPVDALLDESDRVREDAKKEFVDRNMRDTLEKLRMGDEREMEDIARSEEAEGGDAPREEDTGDSEGDMRDEPFDPADTAAREEDELLATAREGPLTIEERERVVSIFARRADEQARAMRFTEADIQEAGGGDRLLNNVKQTLLRDMLASMFSDRMEREEGGPTTTFPPTPPRARVPRVGRPALPAPPTGGPPPPDSPPGRPGRKRRRDADGGAPVERTDPAELDRLLELEYPRLLTMDVV